MKTRMTAGSTLILSPPIFENDVNQRPLDEDEYDRAEEKKTVPQKIDLAAEIGVRDQRGVGMRFVAGYRRDGERGDHGVACKPPEAVGTFHAEGNPVLVVLGVFHLRRGEATHDKRAVVQEVSRVY